MTAPVNIRPDLFMQKRGPSPSATYCIQMAIARCKVPLRFGGSERLIPSQTSEHDPKGTQPQFPIGKLGPAVPGPEAVPSRSSAVLLSVPYEICKGYGEWSMDEKLLAATAGQ
ncbi:hypothetical protein AtubIFM55763_001423 [Aspergillus tubingensis]|nr:hypothetical protein AtubIFM55763_001423 [Aspergillus tubingensis]